MKRINLLFFPLHFTLYIHDLCSARGVLGKRALFVQDELIYMLIHWHVDLLASFHPQPVYLLVLMDAKENGNIKKNKKRGEKKGGGGQGTQSISTTSSVIIFALRHRPPTTHPALHPHTFCLSRRQPTCKRQLLQKKTILSDSAACRPSHRTSRGQQGFVGGSI